MEIMKREFMTPTSTKVMFFSPYAAIWPHAMPEALVAGALQRNGATVVYAVCDGIYSEGCIAMSAYGISGESDTRVRERICRLCRNKRDIFIKKLGVRAVVIDRLLDSSSIELIKAIADKVTMENLETFQYEGFLVGRYAIHETIIHHKLTSLSEMTPVSLRDFHLKLKHVLITYFVGKKLLGQLSPDRIVTYNTHISTNYVLMKLAESKGIPTFGLHAGGNMSDRFATLYVFRQDMVVLYQNWMRQFSESLNKLPATLLGMRNATRHFLALSKSRTVWVYSAPKSEKHFDARAYFGVKPGQKVLLATLSSYDELYSSQMMGVMDTYQMIFPTQVDWIREVISYARQREDLFLIIRVHPRELPNRRDAVHSNHARMLAQELQDLPVNVKVNWPSDGISLYDLIPIVDVGLNGWSSAGKECSMLGVPVVIYAKEILFYPHSLNILATDRMSYFGCIEKAIEEGWSFERVRQVYRWLTVEYTLGTISIKDRFSQDEGARSLLRRAVNRLLRPVAQWIQTNNVRYNLIEGRKFYQSIIEEKPVAELQSEDQCRLNEAEERRVLCEEIEKILNTVYRDVPDGYSKTIDKLRAEIRGV